MGVYIVADNQELTRYALGLFIRQELCFGGGDEVVVYEVSDRAGLVDLLKVHGDAIVVLDYTLFDFVSESQLLVIGERFSLSHWVLVSDELSSDFLRRVVYSSRQFSVVFKGCALDEFHRAFAAIRCGEQFVCKGARDLMAGGVGGERVVGLLTGTELEIVRALAQGKSTKEIAMERFLSVHTVTTHRKNIFRKLGVNSVYEVIRYAYRSGLVDASEFDI